MTDLLRIEDATKRFGDFVAINGVSLALPAGRLTAIIGPNGAGKTTLINLATGAFVPDRGEMYFKGDEITHLPVHQRVRKGLSRSFQVMNIFAHLSVLQNILVPVLAMRGRAGFPFHEMTRETEAVTEARRILREIRLPDAENLPAGTLSHGDQRLLELGIAIAPAPELCFLDEPSSGLTPVERTMVMELIRRLSTERRTTFVIVEHDMDVVFALADWIVVMNRGQVLIEGPPAEIRENHAVREVYLGEEELLA
ncbi:MAG: ABC transporter ATP-binding protein [Betaproteobacteria bacterium]|nr:ABC transporter ATP-binding protein [Betaproteobacteria bacterium]